LEYALQRLGKNIDEPEIVGYLGISSADIARHLLKQDSERVDELVKYRDKFFDRDWKKKTKIMLGTVETLEYIMEREARVLRKWRTSLPCSTLHAHGSPIAQPDFSDRLLRHPYNSAVS